MLPVSTDENSSYLAYHHADKLFGLAIGKKKFVYLTCLHPSSYLWNTLQVSSNLGTMNSTMEFHPFYFFALPSAQGDVQKIGDGYVYFVAFSKLLQRESASEVIEILQQNEVEQLQMVSNTARKLPVFEDGDIVGVAGDYGVAFHHPRKAFDCINKSKYIKTVHVSRT